MISKRQMTITPLRSRTEAINCIPTPKTPKQCKSFCGVVNYLSLFCPDLQTLLKLIVELTKKGRPFVWGKAQENSFVEVKKRSTNPPVLHLPKAEGRFILYSDTSIEGTGSSLWQMQGGKARLLGYASKTLPEACSRYSVTELEMTGLLVNMNLWKSLLKHREFDVAVDHVAVAQIMKAKTEPATTRIMRLLDRLSAYSFNLYYVKGHDMILADYLSRHRTRDKDPSELIPISFCSLEIYRSMIETGDCQTEKYHIHTRAKAREAGETVPDVHGAHKPIDPSYKPEHQSKSTLESVKANRSIVNSSAQPLKGKARNDYTEKQVGQSSPVKRTPRKVSISPNEPEIIPRTTISCLVKPNTSDTPLNTGARPKTHRPDGSTIPPIPSLPPVPPLHLPQPNKILSSSVPEDYGEDVDNMTAACEKCHKILNPHEIEGIDTGNTEEVLAPEIRIPTESELPPPLQDVVDPSKITHKFLPKQGDIDRLLSKINKKVLRDTNLSIDLRDLRAAYVTSPHFKDIYLHLTQNKMPIGKMAAKWLDSQARNYMLLDGLLFKIIDEGEGNWIQCYVYQPRR